MADEEEILIDASNMTLARMERYLWQRKERLENNQKSPQDGVLEFLAEMIRFQQNEEDWLEGKAQPSDDIHASIAAMHQKLETIEASLKPKKERAPRQDQLAKARCQAVAKYLWQANPEMTIADVASHEAVYNLSITNGKRYEARTVRDWVAEVDPRAPEKKIGRPRKAAS